MLRVPKTIFEIKDAFSDDNIHGMTLRTESLSTTCFQLFDIREALVNNKPCCSSWTCFDSKPTSVFIFQVISALGVYIKDVKTRSPTLTTLDLLEESIKLTLNRNEFCSAQEKKGVDKIKILVQKLVPLNLTLTEAIYSRNDKSRFF